MSNIRSGAMIFTSADLYPNAITGGVFETETSTMATPDKDDVDAIGEAEEANAQKVSSEPRKLNLFLAIGLVVVLVIFFGVGD